MAGRVQLGGQHLVHALLDLLEPVQDDGQGVPVRVTLHPCPVLGGHSWTPRAGVFPTATVNSRDPTRLSHSTASCSVTRPWAGTSGAAAAAMPYSHRRTGAARIGPRRPVSAGGSAR